MLLDEESIDARERYKKKKEDRLLGRGTK